MDCALDILEKRITILERQILPKGKSEPASAWDNKTTITQLLLQTQTMISTALSCREAITSILNHMHMINEYLNPTNGEDELEVEAKRHYLLEVYPELKETVKLITTLEKMTPYTNSTSIIKVTELTEKLEQLAHHNLTLYEESQEVTNNVLNALQQYNDITTSIKMLFAEVDTAVTELEIALMPKFETEE